MSDNNISKPHIQRRIEALAARLRRRQLIGSHDVALEVLRLFKEVVQGARVGRFEQLTEHIEAVGVLLQDAGPKELVINNMSRRVINIIKEEYAAALSNRLAEDPTSTGVGSPTTPQTPFSAGDRRTDSSSNSFPFETTRTSAMGSIFDLLGRNRVSSEAASPIPPSSARTTPPTQSSPSQTPARQPLLPLRTPSITSHLQSIVEDDFSKKAGTLKPLFIEAIQELQDEVELTHKSVGEQSVEHVHSGEFILTIGQSRTVEAFLKAAWRKRKFTVIVAETAPSFSGRATALALSAHGITTILIPDSNIFSLLPRCSKVLLGPHAVLADGALLSVSGSLPLCVAADRMQVPVVVVGGMYKFSPLHLGEADWGMRDLGSPAEVLPESEGGEGKDVEVLNPYYDIVPAELVSLYITNLGGHPSSLLYRLLREQYGSG